MVYSRMVVNLSDGRVKSMERYVIRGGVKLTGELSVQGAKNSCLPVLAATVLCSGESVIHNCPDLLDTGATVRILRHLGCRCTREGGTVTVDSSVVANCSVPDELMREMRSSIVFLGAILARCGTCRLSYPGGCQIGQRPIDLHLLALRQMGMQICEDHGYLDCSVESGFTGADIVLSFPSVGATENIILAAATARGTTVITNAAREPEIVDLAEFLNACGARISGAGEGVVQIEGVPELHACEHSVIPDRIVATTYLAAGAITGGDVALRGAQARHLQSVLPLFEEAGCAVKRQADLLRVSRAGVLQPMSLVRTMPYPGFPTDAQAPIMALSCLARGTSVFVENIFESRYKHAVELQRMGAHIKVEGRVAVVEGVRRLHSACVAAQDLRGGAALVLAGLAAQGETQVTGTEYIDRGYERLEQNLLALGARIKRVGEPEARDG